MRLEWHQPCITVIDTDSQSQTSYSNIIKETLDKSVTQDSLGKDLPQDPGHRPCFQSFHVCFGSQDTYSDTQHSCSDYWHTHGTCHSHSHSRSDPPSRFWTGLFFRFSSGEGNKYCGRSGVGKWSPGLQMQPHLVPPGPSVVRVQPARPLFLAKEGIPNEGFLTCYDQEKTLHQFKRTQTPNFSSLQPK